MTLPRAQARVIGRRPETWRGQAVFVEAPSAISAAYSQPGQYCQVRIGEEKGYFTITCPPGSGALEFYVQRGGPCADAFAALPDGAAFEISAPIGRGFGVDEALATGDRLLAFATGSGMAGLRAALERIARSGSRAAVYYGCRSPGDFVFAADLVRYQAQGLSVHLTVSQRGARDWRGRVGYVTELIRSDAPRLTGAWVFLCGVPAMERAVAAWCETHGVSPDRIRTNR